MEHTCFGSKIAVAHPSQHIGFYDRVNPGKRGLNFTGKIRRTHILLFS